MPPAKVKVPSLAVSPANPVGIPLPGPKDWVPGPRLQWPDRFGALDAFLDPTPQGRSRHTTVVIQNETMAERNAVIVCAGVHFIYSDMKMVPTPPKAPVKPGTASSSATTFDPLGLNLDYMSGPTDVDVYAGGATAFRSTDPRRSVIEVRVAIKVRFGYDGRPPYHTADFFAYYNPTEEDDPKATEPTLIIGDVYFELRAKNAIQRKTTAKPVLPHQFGVATPLGYFELRKAPHR
jgi:hypothetical protein